MRVGADDRINSRICSCLRGSTSGPALAVGSGKCSARRPGSLDSRISSREGGNMRTLVVLASVALAATAVSAQSNGKAKGHTTVVSFAVELVNDVHSDGAPNWGDTVTFTTSSTAAGLYTTLNCYQGSTWV